MHLAPSYMPVLFVCLLLTSLGAYRFFVRHLVSVTSKFLSRSLVGFKLFEQTRFSQTLLLRGFYDSLLRTPRTSHLHHPL
jgi:hypothetical protein